MNKKVLLLGLLIVSLSILAAPRDKNAFENIVTPTLEFITSNTELLSTSTTRPKTVVFDNVITEKMITFTGHWAQPYPSSFKVSINDQSFITLNHRRKIDIIKKEFEIPKDSNNLIVVYEWALDKFGKRWHHEEKKITFKIPENTKKLDITFGFDCESRIQIPQAELLASHQLIKKTNK